MVTKRKKISDALRQAVLMEAGYKCANPTCRHILTLELHHIIWVKDGGENTQENLLALCPNCHSLHTQGYIPSDAILAWKSLLVSLNNPNRATVDLLLVLYDEEKRIESEADREQSEPPFRFTGDGLTSLSGLITAGLVKISKRYNGQYFYDRGIPSFEVELTDSGRKLVKAWRDGSTQGVAEALGAKSNESA